MKNNISRVLMDEAPLQILPSLVTALGFNEAIVLQQIHYWLLISKHEKEGYKWVYNSYIGWQKQFPFWGIRTIRFAITSLEKKGILISDNFNNYKMDRTKWYRIDYEKLAEIATSKRQKLPHPCGRNCHIQAAEIATCHVAEIATCNQRLPETTTETTYTVKRAYANAPQEVLVNSPTKLNDEIKNQYDKTDLIVLNEKRNKFKEPTEIEVLEYSKSINFNLSAAAFIDYYQTRAWCLRGGMKMKDWKAAIRTWKHKEEADIKTEKQKKAITYNDYLQLPADTRKFYKFNAITKSWENTYEQHN